MKTLMMCAMLVATASAYAEVNLVTDKTSNESSEYMAKVLSKTMLIDHVPRLVTRNVCEKVVERIHIDKHENIVRVIPNNMVKCRMMHEQEILNVVSGYNVTYEYKGKIVSVNLNYDPGDFIRVKD